MSSFADEPLLISGIQHFAFCRRQWALIHIEQLWDENVLTVEGGIMHRTAHDEERTEKRGDLLITRGLSVFSRTLGITGKCDVVEFHADPDGVSLHGWAGRWRPYPIEYKRGRPKAHDADELQLCAQAMCLEEMLACAIPEGALFYGEPHRRHVVALDDALRGKVVSMLDEMRAHYRRGYTPRSKPKKGCKQCSLQAHCLPGLTPKAASAYIAEHIREASDA